jgi:hypothetical protein
MMAQFINRLVTIVFVHGVICPTKITLLFRVTQTDRMQTPSAASAKADALSWTNQVTDEICDQALEILRSTEKGNVKMLEIAESFLLMYPLQKNLRILLEQVTSELLTEQPDDPLMKMLDILERRSMPVSRYARL